MKTSPAFQFYAQDFFMGTLSMSAAARGCYISMLAASWSSGGAIPNDMNALAKAMSWGPSDPPFSALWDEIKPKWSLGPSGWTNDRLEVTRRAQEEYRKGQSDRGKKSAAARAVQPDTQPEANHGSTSVATTVQPALQPDTQPKPNSSVFDLRSSSLTSSSASTSEVEPLSRKDRASDYSPEFIAFWSSYPKKTGKGDAWRAWRRGKPPINAVLDALKWQVAQPQWLRDAGQFIPHASTWLNQRRWEDEAFHPPQDLMPDRRDTLGVAITKVVMGARVARDTPQSDHAKLLNAAFRTPEVAR